MNVIIYLRTSTKDQLLGIEAQQADADRWVANNGHMVLATYIEHESGKKCDRPEVTKAIGHARRSKAVLVITKLDRLARSVTFLETLLESEVEFVCLDCPYGDPIMLRIRMLFAQWEAEQISKRTKAALGVLKSRGVKLGPPAGKRRNLTSADRLKGAAASAKSRRQRSIDRHKDLFPTITDLMAKNYNKRQIAEYLNGAGQVTSGGCKWTVNTVYHLQEVMRKAC